MILSENKQRMLYSIYHNNARYIKGTGEAARFRAIVEVMAIVDRCFFVPKQFQKECYIDQPLPIGFNVTISQPTTVARMLFLANIKQGVSVLEIGSGSGWNASLLAYLSEKTVVSIERIKMLSLLARKNFENFKKTSKSERIKEMAIEFVFGDAMDYKGKIWKNKYDRIIFTAGVPDNFLQEVRKIGANLLNENGILVFPREDAHGSMEVWMKKKGKLVNIFKERGYAFVPLIKGRV